MGCRSGPANYMLCFPIGPSSLHGNLLARRNMKSTTFAAWPPFFVDVATGWRDNFWSAGRAELNLAVQL